MAIRHRKAGEKTQPPEPLEPGEMGVERFGRKKALDFLSGLEGDARLHVEEQFAGGVIEIPDEYGISSSDAAKLIDNGEAFLERRGRSYVVVRKEISF